MTTYLVADPQFQLHLTGPGHPESPARYTSISHSLSPLNLKTLSPRDATPDDLLLCHTPHYIETVKEDTDKCVASGITDGSYLLSTGDVQICPDSYRIALKAVGAILTGVDTVITEQAQNAFCLVRPPGHHACSNEGMGFCLFNNIAIGARYAQRQHHIKRILIVDWDVHHGNGTQEIFYSDPSVFYFSTHQYPLYPGTGSAREIGAGAGKGFTLNCPISANSNSRTLVIQAFQEKLEPAMKKFKPELVMISAGFDAHENDPLGGFNLNDKDFQDLTSIVKKIGNTYCNGKIVSALEGGYNLNALATSTRAHVEALLD